MIEIQSLLPADVNFFPSYPYVLRDRKGHEEMNYLKLNLQGSVNVFQIPYILSVDRIVSLIMMCPMPGKKTKQ